MTLDKNKLNEFFERLDITRQSPGKKDNGYIGRANGEKKSLQKRYLLWTLREVLDIINDYALSNSESFKKNCANLYHFSKFILFKIMHKEIKWNHDIPHDTCTCEVCDNITLLIRGLNPKLAEILPEDLDKVIDKFACSKENRTSSCMQGTCTLCSKIEVAIANDNSQSSDSELEAVSQDDTCSDEDSTLTVNPLLPNVPF